MGGLEEVRRRGARAAGGPRAGQLRAPAVGHRGRRGLGRQLQRLVVSAVAGGPRRKGRRSVRPAACVQSRFGRRPGPGASGGDALARGRGWLRRRCDGGELREGVGRREQ